MPIVLAIEPDRRQAAHVSTVVRHRVGAELILADTTESALDAIGNRVPDLVLVPALLSPQDDAALAAALRVIAAAAHVRTLTIPVFANTASNADGGGLFARLRRSRAEPTSSVGCDPAVFAEQIKDYLREAAAERAEREEAAARAPIPPPASTLGGIVDEAPVIESSQDDEPASEARTIETSGFEAREVDAPLDAPTVAAKGPSFVEPSFVEPSFAEPPFAETPVEPPPVHTSILETPVLDPYVAEARFEPVLAADAPIASEPIAELPIEPKRMIAPAIVARAKPAPPKAPAADVAEAATGAFVGRTFGDAGDTDEVTIDLSEEIVEILPEAGASAFDQELFAGEPFGLYTLSLDESLDAAGDAAVAPPSPEESNEAAAIASFAEFLEPPPSKREPDETAWTTLGLPCSRQWPAMEGAVVKSKPVLAELVVAAVDPSPANAAARQADAKPAVAAAAAKAAPATTSAPAPAVRPDHLDWSELVASLRQDIERRRKQPPPITPMAPRAAEPHPPSHPRPHLHAIEGKAGQRTRKSTPVQDEWGFFDPQQCGFAALLAKLDEFSEAADEPEVRKTS